MKIAFAGSFATRLAEPVQARLPFPCAVLVDDEAGIVSQMADVDVLISMGFSARMAEAAPRLRPVQVPGAGLDRIDRGAPHVSGWTEGMLDARAQLIAGNIERTARGKTPLNTIDLTS